MLVKNDLFEDKGSNRYRVLAIPDTPGRGWVMPLSVKNGWPIYRDFGVLTGHADPKPVTRKHPSGLPDLAFHTETARARARKALEAIEPLLNNPHIFEPALRGALVKARAKELKQSETTLYRYLRLYWLNGQTVLALIPDFDKIGRRLLGTTANRGRRPKDGKYCTFQMSPIDVQNVETAIRKYFLNGEISTLAGAHFRMREEKYSYLDGNGDSYLLPHGEFPSIHQFRHVARTRFKLAEVLRKKRGKKEFDREHTAHLGSALEQCVGVGHVYEIDATIADIYLVAKEDRSSIIGKPTLYFIYDRWSRLVVGFYAGLENASWTGAMLAILSIAADKRELCARYGVPYNPEDWPAHATFPEKFVGDRGEMASKSSDRICDGMQSTVTNTQSLLPHRKGTVECGFKLFHASIADIAPGYEPPRNAVKRRAKHYHQDASLTEDEFASTALMHAIAHNRRIMEGYDLLPRQVLAKVPAMPLRLWEDDVASRSGALARYDYDYLHLQLLPRGEATVTQDGIFFKHCVYTCPEAEELGWFVSAGKRGNFKIACSYDLRLVDSIVVHDPKDPRRAYECKLAAHSEKVTGYSFAEVDFIRRMAVLNNFDGQAEADQAKAALRRHVGKLSADAVAQRLVAAKGLSKSARRADTAAARDAERAASRRVEARMPSLSSNFAQNVIELPVRPATAPHSATPTEPEQTRQLDTDTEALQRPSVSRTPLRDLLRKKQQEPIK
ncbi:transcriptional antiterminator [Paraburkholderia strydomiana]